MEKKEHYRNILPHFQQPGQAYFITWCLQNSIPPRALERYTQKLDELKTEIEDAQKRDPKNQTLIDLLRQDYHLIRKKYAKAYDDLLHLQTVPEINISKPESTTIIAEALRFFENRKLKNYAFCIMPNHVHWVFETYGTDDKGLPAYLQDIMQSVKRHTSNMINKLEIRSGTLWQKESFDTTIRDRIHLYNAIKYTVNNPVAAHLVEKPEDWPGTWIDSVYSYILNEQ